MPCPRLVCRRWVVGWGQGLLAPAHPFPIAAGGHTKTHGTGRCLKCTRIGGKRTSFTTESWDISHVHHWNLRVTGRGCVCGGGFTTFVVLCAEDLQQLQRWCYPSAVRNTCCGSTSWLLLPPCLAGLADREWRPTMEPARCTCLPSPSAVK